MTEKAKKRAELDRHMVLKAIDAKLEPVREALKDHYEANKCAAHILVTNGLADEWAELCVEAGVGDGFRMRGASAIAMLSEEGK